MAKLGEDIIGTSGLPPFFAVAGTPQAPPENRLGEAVRTSVRALSGFQKETLVTSAATGQSWRPDKSHRR